MVVNIDSRLLARNGVKVQLLIVSAVLRRRYIYRKRIGYSLAYILCRRGDIRCTRCNRRNITRTVHRRNRLIVRLPCKRRVRRVGRCYRYLRRNRKAEVRPNRNLARVELNIRNQDIRRF